MPFPSRCRARWPPRSTPWIRCRSECCRTPRCSAAASGASSSTSCSATRGSNSTRRPLHSSAGSSRPTDRSATASRTAWSATSCTTAWPTASRARLHLAAGEAFETLCTGDDADDARCCRCTSRTPTTTSGPTATRARCGTSESSVRSRRGGHPLRASDRGRSPCGEVDDEERRRLLDGARGCSSASRDVRRCARRVPARGEARSSRCRCARRDTSPTRTSPRTSWRVRSRAARGIARQKRCGDGGRRGERGGPSAGAGVRRAGPLTSDAIARGAPYRRLPRHSWLNGATRCRHSLVHTT